MVCPSKYTKFFPCDSLHFILFARSIRSEKVALYIVDRLYSFCWDHGNTSCSHDSSDCTTHHCDIQHLHASNPSRTSRCIIVQTKNNCTDRRIFLIVCSYHIWHWIRCRICSGLYMVNNRPRCHYVMYDHH